MPDAAVAEGAVEQGSYLRTSRLQLPYRLCKRMLDLAVSLAAIVLLAPVWLLIALLIKLDSPGPVFYTQKAIGLGGREFRLVKFRSMLPDSQRADHQTDLIRNFRQGTPTAYDDEGRPIFKTALVDGKRITRMGRLLRRSSLDEVPQLWSILVGDMSVVGPRPSLPWEAELYDECQRRRFDAKPGLTGLYQVTARNRVSIAEMIRIDLDYIQRQSLWLDLAILVKTPNAMFKGL